MRRRGHNPRTEAPPWPPELAGKMPPDEGFDEGPDELARRTAIRYRARRIVRRVVLEAPLGVGSPPTVGDGNPASPRRSSYVSGNPSAARMARRSAST